ncbi:MULTISPECIES: hypothetical protein [unclassified Streptomyces]|uniref:hypothetical protein n=1 Tax=unclassified Streptomyces TaxID=2593676 RepID=UPI002DD931E6|nr:MULTISPECIES: hypothetical protein [unclassified Streptomyces]WSA96170.1 hypothetical protein OIE63_34900 [Streptomyces sp. NBC_01795]WSB80583.1 hypothetical protein OHB04_36005 [Streptomyces sp. NBC_01775]WSS11207.1 hypothetical protein OG533_04245 [Streptomyces sp. NBC_01186]WSS39917.1 hypothetical protein OG220_04345 [Streptomyces sp. NBC_01187]
MTELPHTRTRTVHWLATAAALAAVLGASALLPSDATANPAPQAASRKAPDPAKAHYPLRCGPAGTKVDVLDKGTADFDKDGSAETVAVVRCRAEGGTPPSAVFVLTHAAGSRTPEVAATLVAQKERMTVQDLKVHGTTVSAKLLGYSSPDVPRCCPDKQRRVKWEWKNGKFTLIPAPVAGGGISA